MRASITKPPIITRKKIASFDNFSFFMMSSLNYIA
jgi:hypothetical protein